ncbi:O-antigen ligase family protein [Candidatus Uabimicrobium amorphum]|uniref:Polymerase n=1 Tax=Uabimicrobium amorphum TaxID=2596890 RepID=A0A5S9IMI0_UABAM|nr:O-antigen ligase family protein [Candidatus Uabimicrobium amorphum]BBM84166.1 polymerase [Candidatus Uabimicrobium amorphum]
MNIKHILTFFILTTMCLSATLLCDLFDQNFLIPKQLVFQLCTLIAFTLWIWRHNNIYIRKVNPLLLSCLLFFSWAAISSFVSPNPFVAISKYTFWFCGVLFLALLIHIPLRKSLVKQTWFTIMFVVVGISYLQYAELSPVPMVRPNFYGSTLGNPNFVACLAAATAVSLCGYIKTLCGYRKICCVISIIFFIFPVLFIGSRGALVGLFVACIVFILLRKNYFAMLSVAILFVVMCSIPLYQGRSLWNKESFHQYGATRERIVIWVSSWRTFREHMWVGTGFEQWYQKAWHHKNRFATARGNEVYKPATKRIFAHTHNDYLEIFLETGIIGGCLFIVLLLLMLYYAYTDYKKTRCSIGAGHFAALFVLLTHSLVSFPLQTAFGYMCLLLNWFFILRTPSHSTTIQKPAWAIIAMLLLLICNTISWAFAHLI